MTFKSAIELFTKVDQQLLRKEVVFCYGMSKMTVTNENTREGEKLYNQIKYVEFLEMIGRIADLKFRGSETEDMELHLKIEILLDDVFDDFALARVQVNVDVREETESDCDY